MSLLVSALQGQCIFPTCWYNVMCMSCSRSCMHIILVVSRYVPAWDPTYCAMLSGGFRGGLFGLYEPFLCFLRMKYERTGLLTCLRYQLKHTMYTTPTLELRRSHNISISAPFFPTPYADNQLLCSLCGSNRVTPLLLWASKTTTRFSSKLSKFCNFTPRLHQK